MLNEKEFYCYVEHHILEYIKEPEDKEVSVQRVCKNNQVFMTGLSIGTKEVHFRPVLYLEPYYHKYFRGSILSDLLSEIAASYEEYQVEFPLKEEKIRDYKFIKKQLFFRIVNYEKNKEQLQICPYDRMEDLAVTYRWSAYHRHDGMASAIVREQDLKMWGITKEKLRTDAFKNAEKIFPPVIKRIENVIPVHVEEGDIPIFVLSNNDYMNGASAMFYQGILQEFAERMKENLYILPSSIHEVILLRESDAGDVRELSYMVKETNRAVVDPEEILSDSVYYYDRIRNKITIAR